MLFNVWRPLPLLIFSLVFIQNLIAVPLLISFQGQVLKDGRPFEGAGSFKFSFIDSNGQVVWRNDGVVAIGEPAESIQINVSRGVFSVVLGDESIANMAALNVNSFNQDNISIRVWFNGGGQDFDLISPDTRITSVGYALKAKSVEEIPNNIVSEASLSSNLKAKIQSISQLEQETAGSKDKISILEGKVSLLETATAKISTLEDKITALEVVTAKISTLEDRIAALESGSSQLGGVFTSVNPVEPGHRKIHTFSADSWSSLAIQNAPSGRFGHASVWNGSEMIVWGGEYAANTYLKTGGLYNLAANSWSDVTPLDAPIARSSHSYVWANGELLIWGGISAAGPSNTGGVYKDSTKSWWSISVNGSPSGRYGNGTVWTGSKMLVWGGRNNTGLLNDLFVYDPSTDLWQEIVINNNKPIARYLSSVVLVGSNKAVLWGGVSVSGALGDGAVITLNNGIPDSSAYVSVNMVGAPVPRRGHTALSIDDKMIIWGGGKNQSQLYSDGAIYNSVDDTWSPISNVNAPSARENHASVWTGKEMLIIAGRGSTGVLSDSYAYNPETDVWRQLQGSVGKRHKSTAVWTGEHVVIFGGDDGQSLIAAPMKLDPSPSVNLFVKE